MPDLTTYCLLVLLLLLQYASFQEAEDCMLVKFMDMEPVGVLKALDFRLDAFRKFHISYVTRVDCWANIYVLICF